MQKGVDYIGINVTFYCHDKQGTVVLQKRSKNGEPHKFEKVKWFKKDELPEALHSGLKSFIEKYKDKL